MVWVKILGFGKVTEMSRFRLTELGSIFGNQFQPQEDRGWGSEGMKSQIAHI